MIDCAHLVLVAALVSTACDGSDSSNLDAGGGADASINLPPASMDWTRDLVGTDLSLDLAAMTGVATITVAAARPPDLLSLLYQLSLEADDKLRQAALGSARALPDPVRRGGLRSRRPIRSGPVSTPRLAHAARGRPAAKGAWLVAAVRTRAVTP
jgi:hypothetical protein